MIKHKLLHILGIFYLIIGFIILLSSFQTITGFAIIQDVQPKITSILGIILISLGLLISTAVKEKEGELEKKVKLSVYSGKTGQTNEENYRMTDPSLYFEQSGAVSLGRFKRDIQHLRESQDGKELIKIVREEYEPKLKELAESTDKEKANIAVEFLKVLDSNYQPPKRESSHEEKSSPEKDYSLAHEEREEIKVAFRQYNGRINKQQREILRKYDLKYDPTGKGDDAKIRHHGTDSFITISRHPPSDYRAGIYAAHDIIGLIERLKKYDAEKRSKKN